MINKIIKCECGNTFFGWADKEDTCPKCLKELINPEKDELTEIIKEKMEQIKNG